MQSPRPLTKTRRALPGSTLPFALLLAVCIGCAGDDIRDTDGTSKTGGISSGPTGASTGTGGELTTNATDDSGASSSSSTGSTGSTGSTSGTTSTTSSGTTGEPTDTTPPGPMQCGFESTTYGSGLQELDVPKGSPTKLVFTVPGLPDPALVESATLRFDSHDADHPGQEGLIWVNGAGPFELPADESWDNQDGTGAVDVTGTTVAGDNTVEFGAGSLDTGSYYFIGNVVLELAATVQSCPEPPPPAAIERTVWYQDASYTKRHNWVLRCDDYAFTAYGDEHIPDDCDGLYAPDGTRKGKGTFAFPDLIPATYEVRIRSRHTENRNPLGALFVVDGEGKRINQRDDLNYTTDIWGTKQLAGDVDVVLDSSMESESDSVIWVKLVPQ